MGAIQPFILTDALPFSAETYSGTDVLVRGIELGCVRVPVHVIHLHLKPQLAPNDSANSDIKVAALKFDREHLIAVQRSDQSLAPC